MSWISHKFLSFAVSRPMGENMTQGSMKIPAGHQVEQDMPEFMDAFTKSVQGAPRDEDNLPARFHDSEVLELSQQLLERVAQHTNPNNEELYPFGYNLLPSKIEKSEHPGILAVDLAPMDMRHTTESLVGDPVARLFIDTTPGQDGIEYFISY